MLLESLISCVLLVECAHAHPTEPTLQFDIKQSSVAFNAPLQRRHSEFSVPLYNNFSWQKFTVDVQVGTPPQSFKVMLDSGSADLWVPSPDSVACAPHCPATFDKSKSSTYRDTGLAFNATYGGVPGGEALVGPYFNDTVRLGPAVIKNMTLALGNVPHYLYDVGDFGIMGLGPPRQEALVANPSSPYGGRFNKTYPVLYERLYRAGYIKQRIFSLWLNSKYAKTGSLLLGGIDKSKYHGKLQYVPIARQGFFDWEVNLNSVVLGSGKSRTEILSDPIIVVMDSGSPNIYLPPAPASAFAKSLNATMVNGLNGPFPYVDCAAGKDQHLEFIFDAGLKIRVPATDIIYPFGDPTNVGEIRDSAGKKLCYLGLQSLPGPVYLLGATLMRSAYVVFDADKEQIGMAPIRY